MLATVSEGRVYGFQVIQGKYSEVSWGGRSVNAG